MAFPFDPKPSDMIEKVEGKVTFTDGETVEFNLSADGATRWGNTREILGRAVLPTDEMFEAIANEELFADG